MVPIRQNGPPSDGTLPCRVTIFGPDGSVLSDVPQRDLFSKYGWPARTEILAALRAFKEQREGQARRGSRPLANL